MRRKSDGSDGALHPRQWEQHEPWLSAPGRKDTACYGDCQETSEDGEE